jgi:hypothetical protein
MSRLTDPHLANLEKKLQLLRDDVASVALGYHTGMLVYGVGGIGKSFTVAAQLRAMNVMVRSNTARMTGRALFDHLRQFPDEIFLIEDNEPLLRDRAAVGVLRSALWASPRAEPGGNRVPDRSITWFTARGNEEFIFSGGIILVMNSPPPRTPEVDALLTRIPAVEFQISDAEMAAHMRHLAATAPPRIVGHDMTADECAAVCEFVIKEATDRNHRLDIRLLYNAYNLFVQYQQGDSGAHWQDRVLAVINRRAPRFRHAVDSSGATRLDRFTRQRVIVREILAATPVRTEQVEMRRMRTQFSERTFDTRKAEVTAEAEQP